jgi:membrane protease YdiL (CAAX protease family)
LDQELSLEPRQTAVAWGLKDVLWASLLGIVLFAGTAFAAAVVQILLEDSSAAGWVTHLPGALVALSELAFVCGVWAFGARKPGVSWRDLGLRRFNALIGCLGALALFFLTLAVNVAWALVLYLLGWEGQPPVQPLFGDDSGGLGLALLATVLVAPFAEELFFRGMMLPPLRRRFGLWLAVAIDAALFSLLHFTPTVFPPIFVMGAFFSLLYLHTGSIWPGVILHGTVNLLAILTGYLAGG